MQLQDQATPSTPDTPLQWETPELQKADVISATLAGGVNVNVDGFGTFSS